MKVNVVVPFQQKKVAVEVESGLNEITTLYNFFHF